MPLTAIELDFNTCAYIQGLRLTSAAHMFFLGDGIDAMYQIRGPVFASHLIYP